MGRHALERRINAAYKAGGYALGWRLLASPASVLEKAEIAFIGLNPGGSVSDPDHGVLAMPAGRSAYLHESWAGHAPGESPLQRQVLALFAALAVPPEQVLAGNLVPFRSPSWAALPDAAGALAFGQSLWCDILEHTRPRLVVTMGRETYRHIALTLDVREERTVSAGWGTLTLRAAQGARCRLVGLPHLSRYTLFGRPASAAGLRAVLNPEGAVSPDESGFRR